MIENIKKFLKDSITDDSCFVNASEELPSWGKKDSITNDSCFVHVSEKLLSWGKKESKFKIISCIILKKLKKNKEIKYPYRVFQYSLSSGFKLKSARYDNIFRDFLSKKKSIDYAVKVVCDPSGLIAYKISYNNKIYQGNLLRKHDLSSQLFRGTSLEELVDISPETRVPVGLYFNDNGTKLYVLGLL